MSTSGTERGPGERSPGGSRGYPARSAALAAAVLATMWWGFAGLATENFGSDCLFHFGETGPRAEHCHRVNDRAEAWLPRLVLAAWFGAAVSLAMPRALSAVRYAAAGAAVVSLVVAVLLGGHALAVSSP
ncbi:hypothetical protein GCM10010420_05440 [Streptomyces glaucosporus]|uniref:Integral membrane protein n=1 Tax=Streptomyces glaucosporus TaxID=284044 RepID=A0ABN3HR52_9ACTN